MVTLAYSYQQELAKRKTTKLLLVRGLFEAFHEANIDYCHWKSNEHLDASMNGDTDLDILFDPASRSGLDKILQQLDFVKFEPVPQKKYNDIEDFIGLDVESGKIIHLHAHFRLTMGEPYLKGYQLNLERMILDTRVLDKDFGVFCTSPIYELILLFCRQALKLRNRDRFKLLFNKGIKVAPTLVREYEWLKRACSLEKIRSASEYLFSDKRMEAIFLGPFDKKQFHKLSILLRKELRDSRTYHPVTALLTRWQREFVLKMKRRLANHSRTPIVHKRVHPTKGLVIAVIGADGSGKSTVIKNINSTFSKKLDVYPIYFGNGGYVSLST
ncbi:MAG: hypothetical protein EOO00_11620, partial [Chitinophagaceae bacterium]